MITIASFFSGLGAFEEAFKDLSIEYDVKYYCEILPFASKSYSIIHGIPESKNLGDITNVNEKELDKFNLMTWGSPCQDFSIIGDEQGAVWKCELCGHEYNPLEVHYSHRDKCPICQSSKLKKTRSSLLVEGLRILRENMPEYSIYENVKNITGDKHKKTFNLFIGELKEYGYTVYKKVVNALNYGLPQNRERLIMVCIRNDIDQGYIFPKECSKVPVLKEFIELGQPLNYDYYLTKENLASYLFKKKDFGERFSIKNIYKDYGSCLTTKSCKSVITNNFIVDIHGIRGLTERESFKLQGFNPDYVELLKNNGISKNQLYYMIGNSISANVIKEIIRELLINKTTIRQLDLFNFKYA